MGDALQAELAALVLLLGALGYGATRARVKRA